VYDVLQRLAEKGLASYISADGVKKYTASNPAKLSELFEEKKKALNEEIPSLQAMFKQNSEKKSTQFFIGKKGIKSVLDEQLRTKETVFVLGGSSNADELLKFYFPKYHNLRKEQMIKMKIIFSGKNPLKKGLIPLSEVKQMHKGKGGDVALNIYGNNVALISWNWQNPFAILIHEKEVADNFRDYFEFMWSKL
jgi:sugar-specific transcriptional regulator TrmB